MACCGGCAEGHMCNSEKWAIAALVLAFGLLIWFALK